MFANTAFSCHILFFTQAWNYLLIFLPAICSHDPCFHLSPGSFVEARLLDGWNRYVSSQEEDGEAFEACFWSKITWGVFGNSAHTWKGQILCTKNHETHMIYSKLISTHLIFWICLKLKKTDLRYLSISRIKIPCSNETLID